MSSMIRFSAALLLVLSLAAGCASGPGYEMEKEYPGISRMDGATLDMVRKEAKLGNTGHFKTIRIGAFDASDELRTDYSSQLDQFQSAMVYHVRENGKFDMVERIEKGIETRVAPQSLKVEGKILDMRITSPAARFWGGALAGSSYMDVYLRITDDSNGAIVQEKVIATHNSALGAAWTGGSSDHSLPRDMGEIIGEYLITVLAP